MVAFLLVSVALAFSRSAASSRPGWRARGLLRLSSPGSPDHRARGRDAALVRGEEVRHGELLFTLPVTTLEAVIGKFLAGWRSWRSRSSQLPDAVTIGYLGSPDWGVVATSYLGAILMAGGFLGVCSSPPPSRRTGRQLRRQPGGLRGPRLPRYSGFTGFLESFLPVGVSGAVSNFSFITHFSPMVRGSWTRRMSSSSLPDGLHPLLNVVALER